MKLRLSVILALVCIFTIGCQSTPIRQAVGTKYTSDYPPLEVEFAYRIGNVKDKADDKLISLHTGEVRDIWVELIRIHANDNQIDYFYSLQNIASSRNFKYFGPVYFEEHQWAKVSKVNDGGWLMCGFFTRKDKWLIFIHNSAKLTNLEMERYHEYQRTLKLSETDKLFIDKLFAELDKAIISIR